VRAGDLDRRITIQQKAVGRNAVGEEVITWLPYAEVWAQKMPLRGQERYEAQQLNAEVSDKWRIRYTSGVVPKMRITYESQNYDIQSVLEIGRREGMELITETGANG